jgi:Ca-activated chloride channel family protein
MLHLAHKIYLLLLVFLPLLILWHIYTQRRGKRFIFFSAKSLLSGPGMSPATWKTGFIKSLFYIKLSALLLFILALARPQLLDQYRVEKKQGIDILISLDISGSMAAVDFKPKNRLEVAKDVIASFIQKRTDDRIGLVIFAGTSYTRCPLTIDYDILGHFLKETAIGELEDGTAIGMALATSVNRIRHSKTNTKIIILLTDGVNNRGEIDPRDAAKIAKDFNVKVYTIGVGTRGQAPYPVVDSFGRQRMMMVEVEIDEKLLQEIANQTGGLYFRATDKDSLQKIFAEIDRWEKSEVSSRRFYKATDLYPYFLLAALLILLTVEVLKRSLLRSLP